MECEKSDRAGHFRVALDLQGEPVWGERFSVSFEVDPTELREFGRALQRWSRAYPPK